MSAPDGPTGAERQMLATAADLLRDQALAFAVVARTLDERRAVNAALLAAINVDEYLRLLDSIAIPF